MLVVAGGAEEQHTSDGVAVGPWGAAVSITIYAGHYTGIKSFQIEFATAVGGSRTSGEQAQAWWSYAVYPFDWGDGTYQTNFKVSTSPARYLGIHQASGTTPRIALFDASDGSRLARANTNLNVTGWTPVKWEFDAGHWTVWADYGAGFVQTLTYDDSGAMTTIDNLQMSVNGSSDEAKGYFGTWVDDCLCWDSEGDNWNSRIPADDFPRIGVAHYPETSDNSISGVEYQDMDEVVPDHAPSAGEDKVGYLAVVEDLDNGTKASEDLTSETIQAVMVTHVTQWEEPEAAMEIFNIKTGGAEYLDSAERVVQHGNDSGGSTSWTTYGGYYPWTPTATPANWDEALFNAAEYGFSLIDGKSDQLTVQVIFGGSSPWWSTGAPPAGDVLKISTIEWASVKKVSAIAEASISKVSTIEAN